MSLRTWNRMHSVNIMNRSVVRARICLGLDHWLWWLLMVCTIPFLWMLLTFFICIDICFFGFCTHKFFIWKRKKFPSNGKNEKTFIEILLVFGFVRCFGTHSLVQFQWCCRNEYHVVFLLRRRLLHSSMKQNNNQKVNRLCAIYSLHAFQYTHSSYFPVVVVNVNKFPIFMSPHFVLFLLLLPQLFVDFHYRYVHIFCHRTTTDDGLVGLCVRESECTQDV